MSNVNLNELDSIHLDVLKEIGNIGSGNATTALANLINKKIDMGVPKVNLLEFRHVAQVLGGEETLVVSILLQVEGDVNGMMMFILEKTCARRLVNMLMAIEENNIDDFNDMEYSALKEIGNIISGAYLSSLSTLTNLNIQPSIPYLAVDMAGAILSVPAIQFGKIGDKALLIQTDFGEDEEYVSGYFILIPEISSFDKILRSLGIDE